MTSLKVDPYELGYDDGVEDMRLCLLAWLVVLNVVAWWLDLLLWLKAAQ